jgi:hypothetical protein
VFWLKFVSGINLSLFQYSNSKTVTPIIQKEVKFSVKDGFLTKMIFLRRKQHLGLGVETLRGGLKGVGKRT